MAFDFKRAFSVYAESKAIPAHPALMDRSVPVTTYAVGAAREDAVISQQEAMRHSQAYGGREAIDWVYDCIGLYSDPAGIAPWRLEQPDGTILVETRHKGTPPDHADGPQDLYRLLHAPNPFMLYDELMALLVIDLLLVGNAYWFKWQVPASGRPLALYRLAPSHVKIKPGPYGPKSYEYQPPGASKPLKIDPSEIIHFRRPNPHSSFYGMGVIQGAGRSMDLEIAVTETMAAYYENRADPSLIIQSERRVPRDVFNKLRAQLRARVAGSGRAGELLVLEAGLKASTLDRKASENLFDTLSKMSQDRIYAKFRASRKLFGLQDTTGQDKVSDVRREFDNYALRPFLTRLSRQISESLTAAWGVNFVIDHQTLLPADEAMKVAGQIGAVPGIKIREVRKQYAQFGIEESTGDPKLDEYVLNMPMPNANAQGMVVDPATGELVRSDSVGSDRPLPGEPGRPPKGTNTRGFGTPQGKALTIEEIEARLTAIGAGRVEHKAVNAAGERVTVGNVLPDEQRPSDPYASARQVDIDGVTSQIAVELRAAAHDLERGLLDTVEGKALKTSDIVKRVRSSDAWVVFKERVTRILEEGARAAAVSGVLHTGKVPEDDIDYDDIARTVVHRSDGLRSIFKTIRDRVANKVKETREADGERADFEAAVRAAINDWTSGQAVAIADSEATEAYNEAVLTTLEAVGETEVYVQEEADAPDGPCQDANGRVWDIGYARQHRKQHPRCRRAFLSLDEAGVAVA